MTSFVPSTVATAYMSPGTTTVTLFTMHNLVIQALQISKLYVCFNAFAIKKVYLETWLLSLPFSNRDQVGDIPSRFSAQWDAPLFTPQHGAHDRAVHIRAPYGGQHDVWQHTPEHPPQPHPGHQQQQQQQHHHGGQQRQQHGRRWQQ